MLFCAGLRSLTLMIQARYRLLRSYFVQTTQWSSFDPFSSQKADTFKGSGKAIYREAYFNIIVFVDPHGHLAEIATTMHGIQEEHAKLESDPDKLGVLFKEMIQMCLWLLSIVRLFPRPALTHLKGKCNCICAAFFFIR
jgi:hypothetical protein